MRTTSARAVEILAGPTTLNGDLRMPPDARGLVIFAHGSGSSRFSTRNRQVAEFLYSKALATLLLDLLTPQEEAIDVRTRQYRFDIERLGCRVAAAADWARGPSGLRTLGVGLFGASTGAAAALVAAAARPGAIDAIVSRGGRPDLAGDRLHHVDAPTLLIVGGHDQPVIEMNRDAMARLRAHGTQVELEIVPNATHLFEEPGALEHVARSAARWFAQYMPLPGSTE